MARFETMMTIQIRPLDSGDAEMIAAAFGKPASQYRRYLEEQDAGTRVCWIATVGEKVAGYVTINWHADYPGSIEGGSS